MLYDESFNKSAIKLISIGGNLVRKNLVGENEASGKTMKSQHFLYKFSDSKHSWNLTTHLMCISTETPALELPFSFVIKA